MENFVALAKGEKDYSTQNAKGEQSGPFYDGAIIGVDRERDEARFKVSDGGVVVVGKNETV